MWPLRGGFIGGFLRKMGLDVRPRMRVMNRLLPVLSLLQIHAYVYMACVVYFTSYCIAVLSIVGWLVDWWVVVVEIRMDDLLIR